MCWRRVCWGECVGVDVLGKAPLGLLQVVVESNDTL